MKDKIKRWYYDEGYKTVDTIKDWFWLIFIVSFTVLILWLHWIFSGVSESPYLP